MGRSPEKIVGIGLNFKFEHPQSVHFCCQPDVSTNLGMSDRISGCARDCLQFQVSRCSTTRVWYRYDLSPGRQHSLGRFVYIEYRAKFEIDDFSYGGTNLNGFRAIYDGHRTTPNSPKIRTLAHLPDHNGYDKPLVLLLSRVGTFL